MDDSKIKEARPVNRWRLSNLQRLISDIDDNETTAREVLSEAVASATGKTQKAVNDHIGRVLKKSLTFGDDWVDWVEKGAVVLANANRVDSSYCKPGVLDFPPVEPIVVYVLAAIYVPAWKQLLSALMKIKGVFEATLVYGDSDMDAVIKLKGPLEELHESILKISSETHVMRTQTLQSVPYSRWQLAQRAEEPELERLLPPLRNKSTGLSSSSSDGPGPEEIYMAAVESFVYPSDRIKELFEEEMASKLEAAEKIASHRVELKRKSNLEQLPEIIVDTAEYRILAVVVWKEVGEGECLRTRRYLGAQKQRIAHDKGCDKGGFEVKRVFVIENDAMIVDDEKFRQRIGREISFGINVRVLCSENWPKHRVNGMPRDFGIMDECACWNVSDETNREGLRVVELMLNQIDVKKAVSEFNAIWSESRQLDAGVEGLCKNLVIGRLLPEC